MSSSYANISRATASPVSINNYNIGIYSPSIDSEVEVFNYHSSTRRTGQLLTPKGSQTFGAAQYEGDSHHRLRLVGEDDVFFTANKVMVLGPNGKREADSADLAVLAEHYGIGEIDIAYLQLVCQLLDLKNRIDNDVKAYIRYGVIEQGHFEFGQQAIDDCIINLKQLLADVNNHQQWRIMSNIRSLVKAGAAYNPLAVHQFYDLYAKGELTDDDLEQGSELAKFMEKSPSLRACREFSFAVPMEIGASDDGAELDNGPTPMMIDKPEEPSMPMDTDDFTFDNIGGDGYDYLFTPMSL